MDIRIIFVDYSNGCDLLLEDADLATDDGLETAAILSLFQDALASEEDELPGGPNADRRGWWGDTYAEDEDENTGSLLWLLEREKDMATVIQRANKYGTRAFDWMIDDGVASKVEVNAFEHEKDALALAVAIYRPKGGVLRLQFNDFWKAR